MAGLPHQRVAAGLGHLVEQHLARLHVGDDGPARLRLQHVAREHDQQLVAEQDVAFIVDHADAVPVAVEGDAEIGLLARHLGDDLLEVLRDRRVGMVVREGAVHVAIDDEMRPGQAGGQRLHDRAGGAVARVPYHLQRALAAVPVSQHAIGIAGGNVHAAVAARALGHDVALRGHAADLLDRRAVERLPADHHLEAVVVGRVVAARHHHRAVRLLVIGGEIQHRRRAEPDAHHLEPAGAQPGHQLPLEFRGMQAAVIADGHARAAAAHHDGTEAAADGEGILRLQRFAHDAADVVFAQDRGIEAVTEGGHGRSLTAGRWTNR